MIRRLLFLGLLLSAGMPLALLLVAALGEGWRWPDVLPPAFSGDEFAELTAGATFREALLTSLALAAGTALLGTAVALPIGRALNGLRGWRRGVGAAAAFLPVAVPPIALATGLQVTLLRLGVGGTAGGVLLAHLVPAVGYLALYFLGVFAVWDARVEAEARSLGATPAQVLLRVTLPMLRPALATAAALGFLISWAQVPLTLLVGRGAVATLPLEVIAFVTAGQDRAAAAGALLLVLPPLAVLAAVRAAVRGGDVVPA